MLDHLTFQQQIALDRLTDGLREIDSATSSIESKANNIVVASTSVISAISGVGLLSELGRENSNPFVLFFAILLLLSVVAMIRYAKPILSARSLAVPIVADVNTIFDRLISQPLAEAYNQVLMDTAKAFKHAVFVNEAKSDQLAKLLAILQIQAVLFAAAVCSKFCDFWL